MADDLSTKTMTAPAAVIKINGFTSGFMRNIRVTENVQRGEVKGISNLTLQEVPATGYTCSFTADFFFISLQRPEIKAFIKRDAGTLENFINTLILGEVPTQIHLYRKLKLTESNGLVTSIDGEGKTIGVIRDGYTNSQSFDITESQISGTNISGVYLTPIIFSI